MFHIGGGLMKEIKAYECEICGELYKDIDKSLKCESFGKETQLASIGDMFKYDVNGKGKVHLLVRIFNITEEGHQLTYHFEDKFFNPETNIESWCENDRRKITGNETFKKICKPMNNNIVE